MLRARVGFPKNPEPIGGGELPAVDGRRHFRVGGGGAQRGRGAGGCGRPPGSLRLRPLGHVHFDSCWHTIHSSNPPRLYTNLPREVVSPIIGTGGIRLGNRTERRFDNLKVAVNGTDYTLNGSLETTFGSSGPVGTVSHTGEIRIINNGTLVARIYGDDRNALTIEVLVPLVPL